VGAIVPFGSNFNSLITKFGSNFDSLFNAIIIPILDTLSVAPAAAYSLRLLRAAYAGFCIRVRRSSDNTEQNIGFVSGVIDTVALLAFVGAGDGFVVTWYDQSVNARNATQATAANQPRIVNAGVLEVRNGKATAFFNRTNSNRLTIGTVAAFDIGTVQAVASYNAATFANFDGCFSGGGASNLGILGNTGTANLFSLGTNFVNGVSTLALSMSNTLDVITVTNTTRSTDSLFIGQDRGIASRFWNGSISECLAFSAALSTADRQLLEANQKAYYATP